MAATAEAGRTAGWRRSSAGRRTAAGRPGRCCRSRGRARGGRATCAAGGCRSTPWPRGSGRVSLQLQSILRTLLQLYRLLSAELGRRSEPVLPRLAHGPRREIRDINAHGPRREIQDISERAVAGSWRPGIGGRGPHLRGRFDEPERLRSSALRSRSRRSSSSRRRRSAEVGRVSDGDGGRTDRPRVLAGDGVRPRRLSAEAGRFHWSGRPAEPLLRVLLAEDGRRLADGGRLLAPELLFPLRGPRRKMWDGS